MILIPSSMAGKGKNKARGTPTSGRRVVVVTNGGAPKRLTNTPTTLNERFTQLARKTQGRDAQVQRGTTARYAATMAKRTGQSAKQFAVRRETREPPPTAPPHAVVASIHFIHSRAQPERVRTSRDSR